jgi:general stress protein 26
MNQTTQDRQQTIATLRGLIHDMQVVMLTTQGADGKLRSRPMAPVRHQFDGDLWFFTLDCSPQVADVLEHCEVNIAYAVPAQHQFVSVSGMAHVVRDRQKLELLWNDELQGEFDMGLATPNLVLLQVSAEEAEFWDQRLQSGSGFLSAMVAWKGSFQDVHERIDWRDEERGNESADEEDIYSALAETSEMEIGHPTD